MFRQNLAILWIRHRTIAPCNVSWAAHAKHLTLLAVKHAMAHDGYTACLKSPLSLLSHVRVTFYENITSLISHGTNPPHLAQRSANFQRVPGPAVC